MRHASPGPTPPAPDLRKKFLRCVQRERGRLAAGFPAAVEDRFGFGAELRFAAGCFSISVGRVLSLNAHRSITGQSGQSGFRALQI